ncbi:TetR/AcrR family transcriptional regulator [Streptomyces uncialis]|uniref:TetR/AcrR family transcriptional regulator n=1 Tax=Streptomyces uncialis TaxID=1048205 RepID=UPI0037F26219
MAARRPPNRKALIRSAAEGLFRDHGYHDVSVAQVAEAVGITAPALYRHYRNKQDLLFDVVLNGVDTIDAIVRDAPDLDGFLRSTAVLNLQQRGIGSIWLRESRHLDDDQRAVTRARAREMLGHVTGLIAEARPGLHEADATLVGVAALGVFTVRSGSRLVLSRRRYERLLHQLATAVVQAELSAVRPGAMAWSPTAAPGNAAGVRLPRRDQLLAAAIRLFDERGFQAVGLGDIAEAAGIVRTAAYRYFGNKTELLVAASTIAGDRMRQSTTEALARATEPREALRLLLHAHITVTMEQARLVGILANEGDQLPAKERRQYQRFQNDNMDIWLQALDHALPGHDAAEAKAVVQIVQAMAYFVIRSGSFAELPDLQDRLTELGMAMLQGW